MELLFDTPTATGGLVAYLFLSTKASKEYIYLVLYYDTLEKKMQ